MRSETTGRDLIDVAQIRNASKTYGSRTVVVDANFRVESGRTTMLVGANGAGKTTTMEMLAGLRSMTSGEAEICGVAVRPAGPHRSLMGLQLQTSGLPARLRTREALTAVASLHADPADIDVLLDELGLAAHRRTPVDKLSGGLRRRLDIACACVGRPRFLLLDEPTSGIDPEGRAAVWDFLRRQAACGVGILASTHDLGEAEAFADHLLVMDAGRIVLRGRPADVVSAAGGEWRIRIASPHDWAWSRVHGSGLTHARSAGAVVALGSESEIGALRHALSTSEAHGTSDVLVGRTRLEDVFAVVGREED